MTLLDKAWAEIKSKPAHYIIIAILAVFAWNGVRDYWQDFKHDIMIEELQARGIELKEEEGIILTQQAVIDTAIKAQEKQVKATDVQTYKNKNEQAKDIIRKQKGLVLTDRDIDDALADQLVSKWTTKK